MARACKALLIRIPGNAAAKMCAFAMHRKKTTIVEPHEEEFAVGERRNTARGKTFNRPCNANAGTGQRCSDSFGRQQHRHRNPASLQDRDAAENTRHASEEIPPRLVHVYHGHTRAIPAPRNQIPVAVRIANATNSSTNNDCTASFLVAANTLLVNI